MNNDKIKYVVIGIIIGGIFMWFLNVSFSDSNTNMINLGSNSRNKISTTQNIDAHFIEQMIPHHEDAITMAKLAEAKAQRPEIKNLSKNIISSQSKEITQMKDWYKNWYGSDVPSGDEVMNQHGMMENDTTSHMGMMGDSSDMTTLADATDFDKAFVQEMIPHHQMAVMMAQMLKNSSERPEMTKLADEIISAQTKEIDQMREWLKIW